MSSRDFTLPRRRVPGPGDAKAGCGNIGETARRSALPMPIAAHRSVGGAPLFQAHHFLRGPLSLAFLPQTPFAVTSFFLFGAILLIGLIGGQLAAYTRFLPRIGGYLAIGILFGPSVLDVFNRELLLDARIYVDIALGLVLFELGRHLDFNWLRHDRWILPMGAAESALTFALILAALALFQVPPIEAALAAAIGIGTSPSIVLLVAEELRAEGQVTQRALSLVAINNIISLLLFTALLPMVHRHQSADWVTTLAQPLYLLVGSVVLGYLFYLATAQLARFVGKNATQQFILMLATVMLAIGTAKNLNLSIMITLITFGVASRNFDPRRIFMEVDFRFVSHIFVVVLFVVTGASLQWQYLDTAFWTVLAFVLARMLGKFLGVRAFAARSRLSNRQAAMLSLTLTPLAGVALGLTLSVTDLYPDLGARLAMVVVSAVAVFHIAGPILTQIALIFAGEADNPRQSRRAPPP